MVKGRIRRSFFIAFSTAYFLACFLCLILPLPQSIGGAGDDLYSCVWADGHVTSESYLSAYNALVGVDEKSVILKRDGVRGEIIMSDRAKAVCAILFHGSLAELLSVSAEGANRIEHAASYRSFGNVLFCDGECFRYTGERVERSSLFPAERVELLGALPKSLLKETGARELHIRSGAEFSPEALLSDALEVVTADAPYQVEEGAILLQTVGGKRLVAGCPNTEKMIVPNVSFYDRGALSACKRISDLTFPFLGGEDDLGYLFSADRAEAYSVPDTLKRVEIKNGRIGSSAFYRCFSLEEIDLCSIAASDIAWNAFSGLPSLKKLHCARQGVLPENEYAVKQAPCGCFVYTQYTEKTYNFARSVL